MPRKRTSAPAAPAPKRTTPTPAAPAKPTAPTGPATPVDAGDDAELAEPRDGVGEPPVGDTDPHAALDDDREAALRLGRRAGSVCGGVSQGVPPWGTELLQCGGTVPYKGD